MLYELDKALKEIRAVKPLVLCLTNQVTMDFMAQVQNYLMSQQYESLLKKANFKTSLGG